MPLYSVVRIATVRKVYEIEAPDEKSALETAALNEPVDEVEVFSETTSVERIKSIRAARSDAP